MTRTCSSVVHLVLAVLASSACRRHEPVESPPVHGKTAEPLPSVGAEEPPKPPPNPSGRWHVAEVAARVEVSPDQQVAGVDEQTLAPQLAATVRKMPQVQGFGPPGAVPPEQRVAVALSVSWQVVDDKGQPRPVAGAGEGMVVLSVTAHAERPVPKGEPDLAERTLDATLPLPAERAGDLKDFLLGKVQQAAEVAVADALGQLWARGLDDAAVLALLDDAVLWRQVAGAREAGERGLKAGREKLEKAARDTRKDLAAVAAAALGRLGDPQSVRVLVACVDAAHPEVVDAALVALADMKGPEALAALRRIAEDHDDEDIRQRAAALLQERAARRPQQRP